MLPFLLLANDFPVLSVALFNKYNTIHTNLLYSCSFFCYDKLHRFFQSSLNTSINILRSLCLSPQLQAAIDLATKAHLGQKRYSGEPYVTHVFAVATRLASLYGNDELTIAGLLHDTVEDSEVVSREMIYEVFGQSVGFMVDAVSKNLQDFFGMDIQFTDKIERFLWAGMKDCRVLLLKLADREHNLATVGHLMSNKQVRMGFETQAIYAPLIERLCFGEACMLQHVSKSLGEYLLSANITSAYALKEHLIAESFANVNGELFGMLYSDITNVVWQIDSYSQYQKMCADEFLRDKISFLKVKGGSDCFDAFFKFTKGAVLERANLRPGYYKSSS